MTQVARSRPAAVANENASLPAIKPTKKRIPLAALSVNANTPNFKTNKQNIKRTTNTTTAKPTATTKKRIPSTATSQLISISKVNSPHLSPLAANRRQSFGFLDGLEPNSSIQRKGFLGDFSFDFGRESDGEEGDDELAVGSCAVGDKAAASEEDEDDPYGICKADREYKRWMYLQPPKTAQVPLLTAESPLVVPPVANGAISTTARDNVIIACPDTPKKRDSSPSISISTDSSPLAPGQKKQYGYALEPKIETKKKGTTGTRKRKAVKVDEEGKEDVVIGAAGMEEGEKAGVKKARTKKESTAPPAPTRRSTRTTSTAAKKKLVVYEDPEDCDE
ncbi:UNVERIFIED_CONTAM: hypothetical protein HDU68_004419 [Siphonaria sp. JEL0065]|nr:hypothetical protein HDU68_004419 [Siphonaria sp. JEL0065]